MEGSLIGGAVPAHRNTAADPTPVIGTLDLRPNAIPPKQMRQWVATKRALDKKADADNSAALENERVQKVHQAFQQGIDEHTRVKRMTVEERERIEAMWEMRVPPLTGKITQNEFGNEADLMSPQKLKQNGVSAGGYPRKDTLSHGKYVHPKPPLETTRLAVFGNAISDPRSVWTTTTKADFIDPRKQVPNQATIEKVYSLRGYTGDRSFSTVDPIVSHSKYSHDEYVPLFKPHISEGFVQPKFYQPPSTAPVGASRPAFVPPSSSTHNNNHNHNHNHNQDANSISKQPQPQQSQYSNGRGPPTNENSINYANTVNCSRPQTADADMNGHGRFHGYTVRPSTSHQPISVQYIPLTEAVAQ
jgi:hypothetical protein